MKALQNKRAANLIRPQRAKSWCFASVCMKWIQENVDLSQIPHLLYSNVFYNASNGKAFFCFEPPFLDRTSCALLTHWDRDKMDAISQTRLSNAFSWMKMLQLRLKFHWNLFLRVRLTIFQHWFRKWLGGTDQATSHYLNQWWVDYRRIYASLGFSLVYPLNTDKIR